MVLTPSSKASGTPSSKTFPPAATPCKTPQSKHRTNLGSTPSRSAHPSPAPAANPPAEHPVEVVGRIRDHPDRLTRPASALQISSDGRSVRVRTDVGYRDFRLDGVSVSEEEDLDEFYRRYVGSRIAGVKLGAKCTVMMYGPTGSGKSHTMFGCARQAGIVYRALKDILGGGGDEEGGGDGDLGVGVGSFVHVTVLEIYNEEIYDLLSSNGGGGGGGGGGLGWVKGNASKVKLEVMGGKAKNATFLSGNEAGKISREVAKVEKKRIVKSTFCNERSSRSHCMIILEVPSVGGRLMLVDMAGSENIDQAGQTGFEAKMQTAKINQGNIALKRVVESIANGDSHVPFRDSKLTMLLQDSFEDNNSKILMILCASPDPKEMHKTISTLEYGAKAKCIVRASNTPVKSAPEDSTSAVLGSRIAAMDQFIFTLQMENKLKEKERNEAHKEVLRKEREVADLKAKFEEMEARAKMAREEEINLKVDERTQMMKVELERRMEECQKLANNFVDTEKRWMEEKILQQQEAIERLGRRLQEIESDLSNVKDDNEKDVGSNFMRKLSEVCADGDQGMEKSMDLDMDDRPSINVQEVKKLTENNSEFEKFQNDMNQIYEEKGDEMFGMNYPERVCLSTVFEADEEGEEAEDEEVEKAVVEEIPIRKENSFVQADCVGALNESDLLTGKVRCRSPLLDKGKDYASSRSTRIKNIFMLCGNHRELTHHVRTPIPDDRKVEAVLDVSTPTEVDNSLAATKATLKKVLPFQIAEDKVMELPVGDELKKEPFGQLIEENKENITLEDESMQGFVEVYVRWEAAKELGGKFVTKLKVRERSNIADLRAQIEAYLGDENKHQAFSFLMLGGDTTGAPLAIDKEMTTPVSKLPIYNNQLHAHLASLRPIKKMIRKPDHMPFSPLENKLMVKQDEFFSPKKGDCLSPLPLNPPFGIRV